MPPNHNRNTEPRPDNAAELDQAAHLFQRQYLFLESSARQLNEDRQLRAHATREYHRRERWRQSQHHQELVRSRQPSFAEGSSQEEPSPFNSAPNANTSAQSVVSLPGLGGLRQECPSYQSTLISPITSETLSSPGMREDVDLETYHATGTTSVVSEQYPIWEEHRRSSFSGFQMPIWRATPGKNPAVGLSAKNNFHLLTPVLPARSLPLDATTVTSSAGLSKTIVPIQYPSLENLELRRGSAYAADPFAGLPIQLTPADRQMLQLYLSTPILNLGADPIQPTFYQHYIGLPVAHIHPGLTYSIFWEASLLKDSLKETGVVQISPQTLYYKMAVIRSLNDSISNPSTRYTVITLALVCSVLGNEHWYGHSPQYDVHARSFSHILRQCGGWSSLENHTELDNYIIFVSLISLESMVQGLEQAQLRFKHQPQPVETLSIVQDELHELHSDRDELASHLCAWRTRIQDLQHALATLGPIQARYQALFGASNFLAKLLNPPALNSSPESPISQMESSSRIFILLHLVMTLWDHRCDLDKLAIFFDDLDTAMTKSRLDNSSTINQLWMVLILSLQLRDGDGDDAGRKQRRWCAVRMTKVVMALAPPSRRRVLRFLLNLVHVPLASPVLEMRPKLHPAANVVIGVDHNDDDYGALLSVEEIMALSLRWEEEEEATM